MTDSRDNHECRGCERLYPLHRTPDGEDEITQIIVPCSLECANRIIMREGGGYENAV